MHLSARKAAEAFFSNHRFVSDVRILDLGGLSANAPLRKLAPAGCHYVSADSDYGPGVDVVIEDTSRFPFYERDFHVVLSVGRLQHDKFFWQSFLEILRVLKPGGLFFLCTPTNGYYQRSPVDNWRLYPDAPNALAAWGQQNGLDVELVESFLLPQESGEPWNDLIAVFQMGGAEHKVEPALYQAMIGATNIWLRGDHYPRKESRITEDMQKLREKSYEQRRNLPATYAKAQPRDVTTSLLQSMESSGVCNICGSNEFGAGPAGRMASNGKAPHCLHCDSLERHRIVHHLLHKLPMGFLDRRRALSFGSHVGVKASWFVSREESPFVSGRSTAIATANMKDAAYDFVCFNHMLEFLPDAKAAFSELMRLLAPRGILVGSFAAPMQRASTEEFAQPAGQHGLRRLFGRDLAHYFDCPRNGVSMIAIEEIDPSTEIKEVVHVFSKDDATIKWLQQWLSAWKSIQLL